MRILCIALFTLQFSTLLAGVGEVLSSSGDAYILRKFKKVQLRPGLALEERDNLYTRQGSVSLKMEDDSIIDLGPKSHFKVKNYVSDGASPKRDVLLFNGTSRFKVTSIKSQKEESFTVKTPTSVVGVRGTDFNVTTSSESTTVTVFEGSVACYSAFDQIGSSAAQVLGEGFQSKISKGKAPSTAVKVPKAQLQSLKGATQQSANNDSGSAPSQAPAATPAPPPTENTQQSQNLESARESIQQDTLELIQETVVEEVQTRDSSIFDQIQPIAPPTSKE